MSSEDYLSSIHNNLVTYVNGTCKVIANPELFRSLGQDVNPSVMTILLKDVVANCEKSKVVHKYRISVVALSALCYLCKKACVSNDYPSLTEEIVYQYTAVIRNSSFSAFDRAAKLFGKVFRKLFHDIENSFHSVFQLICATDVTTQVFAFLGLIPVVAAMKNEYLDQIKIVLLNFLTKKLQGSYLFDLDLASGHWYQFYKSINMTDWKGSETIEGLCTLILKTVKKSPEMYAHCSAAIVFHSPMVIDTTDLINGGIMSVCLRMLKSDDNMVKSSGIKLLSAIVRRIASADSFEMFFKQLLETLLGKWPGVGIVTHPTESQKTYILLAVLVCLDMELPDMHMMRLSQFLSVIANFLEREKDLNLSVLACSVFSRVVISCFKNYESKEEVILKCSSLLQTAVKNINATFKTSSLLALCIITDKCSIELSPDLIHNFIDSCKDITKKGPAMNIDGYFMFTLLVRCIANEKYTELIKGSKVIFSVCSSKTFFSSENFSSFMRRTSIVSTMKLRHDLYIGDIHKYGQSIITLQVAKSISDTFLKLCTFGCCDINFVSHSGFQPIIGISSTRNKSVNDLANFHDGTLELIEPISDSVHIFTECVVALTEIETGVALENIITNCNICPSVLICLYMKLQNDRFQSEQIEPTNIRILRNYLNIIIACTSSMFKSQSLDDKSIALTLTLVLIIISHPQVSATTKIATNVWKKILEIVSLSEDNCRPIFHTMSTFIVDVRLYQNQSLNVAAMRAIQVISHKIKPLWKLFPVILIEAVVIKVGSFMEMLKFDQKCNAIVPDENENVSECKQRESQNNLIEKVRTEQSSKLFEHSSGDEVDDNTLKLRFVSHINKLLQFVHTFDRMPIDILHVCLYKLLAKGTIFDCFSYPEIAGVLFDCLFRLISIAADKPFREFTWYDMSLIEIMTEIAKTVLIREVIGSLRMIFSHSRINEQDSDHFRKIFGHGLPDLLSKTLKYLQTFCSPFKLKSHDVIMPSMFFAVLPILTKFCEWSIEENTNIAFIALHSIWPKLNDWEELFSKCHYYDEDEEYRSIVSVAFQAGLSVLGRFPRTVLQIEEFFTHVGLDAAPLSYFELAPLLFESGLLNIEARIRLISIRLMKQLASCSEVLNIESTMDCILWIACFDEDPQVRLIARQVWGKYDLSKLNVNILLEYLGNKHLNVRTAAANSVATLITSQAISSPEESVTIIERLKIIFTESRPLPIDTSNARLLKNHNRSKANEVKLEVEDSKVLLRCSIAKAFGGIARHSLPAHDYIIDSIFVNILKFIIYQGSIDRSTEVKSAMLQGAKDIIAAHGASFMERSILLCEDVLSIKQSQSENVADFDNRYSATVIFLGTTGCHFKSIDDSLLKILTILLESLKIPSESVQRAVADCLLPISKLIKDSDSEKATVDKLLATLFDSASYGERRGAAFGLAAIVRGIGIHSLQKYGLVSLLKEHCGSNSVTYRQGSLFAYECFAERLGILFEPYLVKALDGLLVSFSHSSDHVRDAARAATKVIISKLSSHGVKLVLNPIIHILEHEKSWKSRQEAIRLLGMMTNCAPKELGSSLSQIIPILVKSGTDHHPKIKDAAKQAMTDISAVIRNPEIASMSPILLDAFADPANKTKDALDTLLVCEFLHSIDASSLSLLVPILSRGLKDRNKDIKRKAAAITGNIISMVGENVHISPESIFPGLKEVIVDPTPDVRACGAKALGALYSKTGLTEASSREIVGWLLETMKSSSSPVERSGAAQGLAEICGCTVDSKKQDVIIQWVLSYRNIKDDSSAKEGMMWFFTFLPYTLRESFAAKIETVLPVILKGLSDNNDGVREVAMRAGKVVVSVLGMNHAVELAPAILTGLFQEDWRIRLDSLQLLGDLLYLIGDTKVAGSNEEGEDDGTISGTVKVVANIKACIGIEKTIEVLSGIYLVRSDVVVQVRQAALVIWKSVVSNTPRTILEIMPTLVQLIVEKLSSNVEDLQEMAGKCVGEIVTKLGDKILPAVIRPLQEGLVSEKEDRRLGSSIGLFQVMNACSRKQCEEHINAIIGTIKLAICDTSQQVVELAARTFMILYKTAGSIAVNEIVPALLKNIESDGEQSVLALRGLREIVALKPRDMLEYLLPMFTKSPIELVAANALKSVIEVSGQYLHFQFGNLIPCLTNELCSFPCESSCIMGEKDKRRFHALVELTGSIVSSIVNNSLNSFISEIGKQIDHETNCLNRKWGLWITEQFFLFCKADYSAYLPVLLKYLLGRIIDADQNVLCALRDCLSAMITNVSADEITGHFEFIKNCITSTASSARHSIHISQHCFSSTGEFILPLFSIPKSLDPFLTMFLHGLMNGSLTTKEIAADMIGEIASIATVETLKPTLIKTIGPLIRIIGERSSSSVKASILKTIGILMDRGSVQLKPFAPQLQTVLVKSLSDPLREVRVRACAALGKLLEISLRIDPLLTELATMAVQAESKAIKHSILHAICTVLSKSGQKASPIVLEKVQGTVVSQIYDEDELVRIAAAKCINNVIMYMDDFTINELADDLLLVSSTDECNLCGRILTIGAIFHFIESSRREEVSKLFSDSSADERLTVKVSVARAISMMLTPSLFGESMNKTDTKACSQYTIHTFVDTLIEFIQHGCSSELSSISISSLEQAAKGVYGATSSHMQKIFPCLIFAVKGLDLRVKYVAERTMKILIESPNSHISGSPLYQQYASKAPSDVQIFLRDYYKRRLSEMTVDYTANEYDNLY